MIPSLIPASAAMSLIVVPVTSPRRENARRAAARISSLRSSAFSRLARGWPSPFRLRFPLPPEVAERSLTSSTLRSPPRLTGHAENALGDGVSLHFGGAGFDGVGPAPQERPGQVAGGDADLEPARRAVHGV